MISRPLAGVHRSERSREPVGGGRGGEIDTLKTPYWGPDGELIGVLGILI